LNVIDTPATSTADLPGSADSPPESRGRSYGLPGGMRGRVLVSFLALLVISTAASVLVLRQVLLSRIDDQVQESLTEKIDAFSRLSESGVNPRTNEPFRGRLDSVFSAYLKQTVPLDKGALVTFIGGREHSERTADPSAADLPAELVQFGAITSPVSGQIDTPMGKASYVAIPVTGRGSQRGVLAAAALLEDQRDQVATAVKVAVGVSTVVMLLASLFIWLAAGRALAPLKALSNTARSIHDTDLSRRITVRGNDEIAELGMTFNEMLDRLDYAFTSQRAFMADVSHELRTPITIIRGHLETLGDDPDERREAMAVVADELDRMSRLVDDLLVLARSSRPDFLRVEPLDLDLLTHDLFAKARQLGPRDWGLDEVAVGLIHADPQRITQAVMNLADNAVRHTKESDRIAIGSSTDERETRIWVRDSGPGISQADQQQIFERFAAGQKGGGAGLGLSIVRAVAEAHGGRVELDSAPGRGATFVIVIPTETAPGPRRSGGR
jgi:two-component system, OmpR family, sensor kinase